MSLDVGARADFRDRCAHSRRDLAAAFGCWEDLSGVEPVGSAEGCLEPRHHFQIVLGEYPRHVIPLLVPYAVFAGDGTARGHPQAHDLLPKLEDALRSAWDALVEHDVRVEVAVAGVKDIRHAEAKTLTGLVDAVQHGRE